MFERWTNNYYRQKKLQKLHKNRVESVERIMSLTWQTFSITFNHYYLRWTNNEIIIQLFVVVWFVSGRCRSISTAQVHDVRSWFWCVRSTVTPLCWSHLMVHGHRTITDCYSILIIVFIRHTFSLICELVTHLCDSSIIVLFEFVIWFICNDIIESFDRF